jgi:hypothetical protein
LERDGGSAALEKETKLEKTSLKKGKRSEWKNLKE